METSRVQAIPFADRWYPRNFRLTRLEAPYRPMQEEVLAGLKNSPKTVSPKFLYDAEGSRLFDRICELSEYYLTRTEISILQRNAGAILERLGHNLCLIELGAGACHKGELLLDTGRITSFMPVDISAEYLQEVALRVAQTNPGIAVHAVAMDFLVSMGKLEPLIPQETKRLILYAGSSIGNFDLPASLRLLRQLTRLLRGGDALLIGYDLKKDATLLRRAYDDSEGITAAFNLNLLARFNRELGADFDLNMFRHLTLYDENLGRIEMHLESLSDQEVRVASERVTFDRLERIHTENSYKYTLPQFEAMAAHVGLTPVGIWKDRKSYFAVGLYEGRGAPGSAGKRRCTLR